MRYLYRWKTCKSNKGQFASLEGAVRRTISVCVTISVPIFERHAAYRNQGFE
jgi:hypothetical protein